jgi:hypothetical protein
MQIKVQDALFGFPIGNTVRLTLPNGSSRIVTLGAGHSVTLTGLPRATYQLVAKGPGFGLASPSTLSKPQVAQLLLLSWVDILAVVTFLALFVVGLPVLGGRIVRRKGGIRLPVWHVGRPRELPAVAAPEEPVDGTPVPGSATEEPAVTTSQPGTAPPEGGSVSKEPAATAAEESEAVTEVFAAISDTRKAAGPGQATGPDAADHASSPGTPNGARTRAVSASPARPPAAGARNGANGSGSPAAGSPPYPRPVSPWVKRTTWPSWNGRKA